MYDVDAHTEHFKTVTEEELLEVLKSSKGDKTPGLDGWMMELFSHFFIYSNMIYLAWWRSQREWDMFTRI